MNDMRQSFKFQLLAERRLWGFERSVEEEFGRGILKRSIDAPLEKDAYEAEFQNSTPLSTLDWGHKETSSISKYSPQTWAQTHTRLKSQI